MTRLSAFLSRLIWLAMAPLVLLALWLAVASLQELEDSHLDEGASLAQNFAQSIDQHLRARTNALRMLAASPLADDPKRWPELYAEAQAFRESFGIHVIFADQTRQMLFNTRVPFGSKLPRLPDSKGKTAAILALETGQPQVGDIVLGPVAKVPLVAIAVPVLRQGKETRLLLSIFETSQFNERVDKLALPDGWAVSLRDGTGADIARRSPPGFDATRDVEDDHRFVVPSQVAPWSVVLEIPRSSHSSVMKDAGVLLGTAIALAIVLGILGGTLAGRRLSRQVGALGSPPGQPAVPIEIDELRAARELIDATTASLRDSQERLQLLIDHAPAAMAMFDREMRYLALSRRWREDYALGEREILGHSHYEIFPDLPETWKAVHQRGMAGEIIRADDDPFERADGHVQWLRWEMRPWHKLDGSIGGIVIFSEDITRRKQADEALRTNEKKLRSILDFSTDAIFLVYSNGRFHYANRRAEIMLGWQQDELLQLSVADTLPADRLETSLASFQRCVAGSGEFFETELQRKDGSRVPVEINGLLLPDGMVLGEVRDITERKEAERKLRASLEEQRHGRLAALSLMEDAIAARHAAEDSASQLRKLSMAVEQSPESIVITDISGNIEYANEAFLRQTGYPREEVIGQNPRFLQSGKTPQTTYLALWDALTTGHPWKGELYNRRKDGSEYVEFAIITPIRQPTGEVSHYVAVKEDVTEKKRMGAELDNYRLHLENLVAERTVELEQARTQAESANRAKSSFLANMSHEIRTPMNAIIGFTHLMRRDTPSPVNADRLIKIESAARHLLAVINDILDLSKIEAGRVELEGRDFALPDVLDHVATLIADGASAKGLLVTMDHDSVPHWLCGDITRLRQALLNFAGNAVKFTERGTITLRSRLLEEEGGRCLVRFEVEDTGIGIAADVLPHMFRDFQQGDISTTRKFGGTGLGLSITRRLARMMGGDAGVVSTPGVGSTFWFTARLARGKPTAANDQTQSGSEAEVREKHAGARILLAEDNLINREVAIELLRSAGLVVDEAADGQAAVDKVRAQRYDLVLMDMLMPNMDGLAASRAIRALPCCVDLPILAMTANAFDEDRQTCADAGMSDFVAKPVDPPVLFAMLLKWLPVRGAAGESVKVGGGETAPASAGPAKRGVDSIIESLGQDPDMDLRQGLAALRGQQDKLVSLLRSMASAHIDDMAKLGECLQRNDREAAHRIAHTLKGVAATLGARRLAESAQALIIHLRNPADHSTQTELAALMETTRGLLESLYRKVSDDPGA